MFRLGATICVSLHVHMGHLVDYVFHSAYAGFWGREPPLDFPAGLPALVFFLPRTPLSEPVRWVRMGGFGPGGFRDLSCLVFRV